MAKEMRSEKIPEKDLPFIRSANNYDRDLVSDATGLSCPEPTLARQEFAEESDINYIADRYGLTGEMPVVDGAKWGNFEGIFDFQSAQNAVIEAKAQFMELPAKLRARFDNDPGKLLNFLNDPENRKEAEFLGLLEPPEAAPDNPQGGAPSPSAPGPEAATKPPEKTNKDT